MAEITMPRLSDTMEEGTIAQWLKQEGDKIARGDVLLEIETDKATMEQESYEEGVLEKILVGKGQTVPIGTVIGIIGDGSGKAGGSAAPSATPAQAPSAASGQEAAPSATAPAPASTGPTPTPVSTPAWGAPAPATTAAPPSPSPAESNGGRALASPMARRIAEEHGLSLANIQGSGPGGRIVKDDVLAAAQSGAATAQAQAAPAAPAAQPESVATAPAKPAPAPAQVAPAPGSPMAAGVDYQDHELSRMGQTVARRMTEAKQQVPHIYLTIEINMTEALKWRQTVNAAIERKGGSKASVNDIIIKAAAVALRKVPAINSGFIDNKIRTYNRVHIAIAVALPDGLITPVVRDADQKSLSQIAQEARQLAEKARAGKLAPNDYQGGTFTISNLGMYGIENFQAVINQPQSAILAVGASKPTVIIKEGSAGDDPQFEVIQAMKVTASFDHRAVNGAIGAQFLQELKNLLEDPMQLLV